MKRKRGKLTKKEYQDLEFKVNFNDVEKPKTNDKMLLISKKIDWNNIKNVAHNLLISQVNKGDLSTRISEEETQEEMNVYVARSIYMAFNLENNLHLMEDDISGSINAK